MNFYLYDNNNKIIEKNLLNYRMNAVGTFCIPKMTSGWELVAKLNTSISSLKGVYPGASTGILNP